MPLKHQAGPEVSLLIGDGGDGQMLMGGEAGGRKCNQKWQERLAELTVVNISKVCQLTL